MVIYLCFNIFFNIKILTDTHTKIWTESTDIVVFRNNLLKFYSDVEKDHAVATVSFRIINMVTIITIRMSLLKFYTPMTVLSIVPKSGLFSSNTQLGVIRLVHWDVK